MTSSKRRRRDVPVEVVLAPVGDEQVGEAIVVVVGRADALAPAGRGVESHLRGDVREAALAVVVVQPAGAASPGHEEDVEQAVVVVVEKGRAAAGGLEDELLGLLAAVGKRAW